MSSKPDKYKIWKDYWTAYGGVSAIRRSDYSRIALILTCVTLWLDGSDYVISSSESILSGLLGFSIGGMAVLIGVIQPQSFEVLSEKDEGEKASIMSELCASFFHFVLETDRKPSIFQIGIVFAHSSFRRTAACKIETYQTIYLT